MLSNIRNALRSLTASPSNPEEVFGRLEESSVPVTRDPCRYCADPCEEGHDEYPPKFDVDMISEMLGSVKPYHRQVIISTGVTDWPKEVTEVDGSLAEYVKETNDELLEARKKALSNPNDKDSPKGSPKGSPKPPKVSPAVFTGADASRLAISNGSHRTLSEDPNMDTVLVFPDYKLVTNVERSKGGAEILYQAHLDQGLDRAGASVEGSIKSWTLPYHAVILLCSHRRRDTRCGVAAPKLEAAFTRKLSHHGWDVHTQLEDICCNGPPLEELPGSHTDREAETNNRIRSLEEVEQKKALILKISHIGGHKFAGNVIIYTPLGAGIWYGRVSTHNIRAIVESTILGGKVLPKLLRGGLNLSTEKGKTLMEW